MVTPPFEIYDHNIRGSRNKLSIIPSIPPVFTSPLPMISSYQPFFVVVPSSPVLTLSPVVVTSSYDYGQSLPVTSPCNDVRDILSILSPFLYKSDENAPIGKIFAQQLQSFIGISQTVWPAIEDKYKYTNKLPFVGIYIYRFLMSCYTTIDV